MNKGKRTGKTTRLIDRCVQELFNNGFTFLYDARHSPNSRNETKTALNKFKARMSLEHPHITYSYALHSEDGITSYKITINNL